MEKSSNKRRPNKEHVERETDIKEMYMFYKIIKDAMKKIFLIGVCALACSCNHPITTITIREEPYVILLLIDGAGIAQYKNRDILIKNGTIEIPSDLPLLESSEDGRVIYGFYRDMTHTEKWLPGDSVKNHETLYAYWMDKKTVSKTGEIPENELERRTFVRITYDCTEDFQKLREKIGKYAFHVDLSQSNITELKYTGGKGAFEDYHDLEHIDLPETLETIGQRAFYNKSIIFQEIVIPKNVTEIGDEAFWSCSKLERVQLPKGLKNIGKNAFSNCESLEEIEYEGTEEDWKKITLDSDWRKNTLDTENNAYSIKRIKCSDGILELPQS
ncbi:MAG: leucine-rich repeat domain-containing protein [Treponema sp.]|nr:leucine-rich repeat domain-containing protein [Treponema sp.]